MHGSHNGGQNCAVVAELGARHACMAPCSVGRAAKMACMSINGVTRAHGAAWALGCMHSMWCGGRQLWMLCGLQEMFSVRGGDGTREGCYGLSSALLRSPRECFGLHFSQGCNTACPCTAQAADRLAIPIPHDATAVLLLLVLWSDATSHNWMCCNHQHTQAKRMRQSCRQQDEGLPTQGTCCGGSSCLVQAASSTNC
jgi:hypothetical protein